MKIPHLVTILLATFASLASHAAERKPNFLFIYTDDQRWDALGVVQREHDTKGRYPWFRTPNMDRIAAEGMRFRNAFVTLPLCAPSRSAFLTGRYNHNNGVVNNHTPFPEKNVTHANLLRAAGYKTAYVGKWHHNGQRGKRPGFDFSASFIGQGRYFDCPVEINGTNTLTTGWVDDVSTDFAIEFIKQNKDKPFSVIVGYKACHGPNTPPERAKNRFEGEAARAVPNLNVRAIYRSADEPARKRNALISTNEASVNLNYFRCISAADDCVGRLLGVLDELNLAENTVVVFTSDNGYYHGEHGLSDKRSLYDESIRVPMLVRYPILVAKGAINDELVLNIDVAPTFLELAGVRVPREMQGKSWVRLLGGKKTEWRESFLAEYFYEQNFETTPTTVAVRTRDSKLIKFPGHDEWTELFDLKNDPYETKNLIKDPAHKKLSERMEKEFKAQVKATGYHLPDDADKPGAATPRAAATGRKRRAASE